MLKNVEDNPLKSNSQMLLMHISTKGGTAASFWWNVANNFLTIEEITLVLQYLADLVDPDLTDSRTCWMEGVPLQVATRWSGGEGELAGVIRIFF